MIARTQYDPHDRVMSNPGSRDKQLYKAKVNDQGAVDLVPDGTESLYDYIQSFADSCDINTIVKKYAAGDPDVLSRTQGAFIDATQFPTTYRELLDSVIAGENYFQSLPLEVRAKFNHNFGEWMASMDDMPSFLEKMGFEAVATESATAEKAAAADVGRAEGPANEGGNA